MSFSSIERKAITEFRDETRDSPDWEKSSAGYLRPTAPSTKGRFARRLIEQLATDAGVPFAPVSGRSGNRRLIGKAVCELKLSMESPARFQQVRPPTDGYDYLVGICIQPSIVRYWLILQVMSSGFSKTSKSLFSTLRVHDGFVRIQNEMTRSQSSAPPRKALLKPSRSWRRAQ
jgi:hypothetical protein